MFDANDLLAPAVRDTSLAQDDTACNTEVQPCRGRQVAHQQLQGGCNHAADCRRDLRNNSVRCCYNCQSQQHDTAADSMCK